MYSIIVNTVQDYSASIKSKALLIFTLLDGIQNCNIESKDSEKLTGRETLLDIA